MQLLTVYTEEVFFYENKVRVSLKQDKLSENLCYLECKRDGKIIFMISVKSSIYNSLGVDALIEMQFKLFGISEKMLYSEKRFTYILQPATPFHSLKVIVCGEKDICFVTYAIDGSPYSKSLYLYVDYENILFLRQYADCIFWNVVRLRVSK